MALKGTLKDFSVADIFQLIAQQTKSGSLFVRSNEKEAHVVFDEGKVVLGTFRKSNEDFLLGTMLLRAGVIDSDQLSEAIENQRVTLRSLGDILRSMGAITPEILGEFVSLQLKEVLFRLFQWTDGLYEFVSDQIRYNKSIIKPQSAEGVLMDGYRMLDEWPGVIGKVGSLEMVFRSLADPGEIVGEEQKGEPSSGEDDIDDAFSEFDDAPVEKPKESESRPFDPQQKKVLMLLDGSRSLQEVIYLTRLGTFDTCRIVAELLDRSLVIKVDQLGQTRIDAGILAKSADNYSGWLLESYKTLLLILVLSVSLPIVAFGVRSHWSLQYKTDSLTTKALSKAPIPLQEISSLPQLQSTRLRLELFRLDRGEYPASLDLLEEASKSEDFAFRLYGDSYILLPPPPHE